MAKTLVIGIDGADPALLQEWMDNGHLPTFARLAENGVFTVMKTVTPPITCPAVPCFYTGMNPGNLGFLSFQDENYDLINPLKVPAPAFWEVMSDAGMTSCIVNLPVTYPPQPFNGAIIARGKMNPPDSTDYTYPPGLAEEITFPSSPSTHQEKKDATTAVKEYIDVTRQRFDTFLDVSTRETYDLSLFWVNETDAFQHKYWDEKEAVLEYYQEIDGMLSETVEQQQWDNIFIFSDHGFQDNEDYDVHLNTWLLQNGYLSMKGGETGSSIFSKLYSLATRFLPATLKNWVRNRIQQQREAGKALPGVDWEETVASLYQKFGIRLHISEDAENYETVRNQVIADITALTGPEGNPVFTEVKKGEEVYSGRYMEKMPDIVLFPKASRFNITGQLSENIFNPVEKENTGTHNSAFDAVLLASGEDIAEEVSWQKKPSILDLAPTLLHLHNTPLPPDIDGRVLEELFASTSNAASRPPQRRENLNDIDI